MSLLTIMQDAADEIGISQPTVGISSTDSNNLKMVRYANKVGKNLMRNYAWQALTNEKTFTAVGTETQTGILPANFDRFIAESFWNRTGVSLITGPISVSEWQGLKASLYSNTANQKFRHRGDAILVIPTLTAGDSLAFEYVSSYWVDIAATGTPKATFTIDTDISLIDEELITRGVIYEFLEGEGLPSMSAAKAYLDYFKLIAKNDNPTSGVASHGDIFGGSQSRHYDGTPFSTGGSSIT